MNMVGECGFRRYGQFDRAGGSKGRGGLMSCVSYLVRNTDSGDVDPRAKAQTIGGEHGPVHR